VPGNLRLRLIQDLNEIANADFLISHQVQEPQPGIVSKCLKEALNIESFPLLSEYDVNAAAASVKVYALKPLQRDRESCCRPTCCIGTAAV
jgi:hypothetical protein